LTYLISFFVELRYKESYIPLKLFPSILLLILFSLRCAAQSGYDTVKVYFPINITELDKEGKARLDSTLKIIGKKNLLIYGYADYLGNEPRNLDLAIGRANNVKQYLIDHNISTRQILICEGIGEVSRALPDDKNGIPEDRRVGIFIKRDPGGFEEIKDLRPVKDSGTKKRMSVQEITKKGTLIPVKPFVAKKKPVQDTVFQKPIQKKTNTGKSYGVATGIKFERLKDLRPNDVLRVEAIHFLPTRHFLTEESEPILKDLLKTMQDYPQLAIRIEGHVCCVKGTGDALDTDTYDLKLSVNRARHIYLYLIQNGIDGRRLEYAGFGKSRPIIPFEKTEEDAQKNRRVEIRVLRN
jgi:outer membrane protein OmpA-like peptidoglycan-associated protein